MHKLDKIDFKIYVSPADSWNKIEQIINIMPMNITNLTNSNNFSTSISKLSVY